MVPVTESDRERRQGCARGAVVGHSGVPSLVCCRCSLRPLRVRPSARPSVRSSRRLARARGGGRENKNGRERIGGLFYRGRGRSGVLFTLTGKRESILSRKETGNVVRLSRIPGRGTDCFRFLRKKRKGEEWTPDKSAGPLSRTGSLGGGPVIPRLVKESVYRVYSRLPFLVYFWR